MTVKEAIQLILRRMEAGQYYRWDLGYNNIIKWEEESCQK